MESGVQCRIHKGSTIIPILSRINPLVLIPVSLRSILILSSHLRLGLPKGLLPVEFWKNYYLFPYKWKYFDLLTKFI